MGDPEVDEGASHRGELRRLFALSNDELAAIDALDTGKRGGPEPEDVSLATYGRPIPEA